MFNSSISAHDQPQDTRREMLGWVCEDYRKSLPQRRSPLPDDDATLEQKSADLIDGARPKSDET
jgi:hypothetical protein